MKTSILPEREKFFNNDKIIEQIELTNLLFQSVPINMISLKLSAEMFLKLFHVEEFICFILLYQTIRQFGHYITATGTLRFIQKYVQVVISFDEHIPILGQFQSTALFYQSFAHETFFILLASPEAVHSDLTALKP